MTSISEIEQQFNIKVHSKPSNSSKSTEKEKNHNDGDMNRRRHYNITINDVSNRLCKHLVTGIHIESNFELRYMMNTLSKANTSVHTSVNDSLVQQFIRSQFYWCYPQQDIELVFSFSTNSHSKHAHSNDFYQLPLPNRNDTWFELPETNSALTCLIENDIEHLHKKKFLSWQKSFYSILQAYFSTKIEGSDICQFYLVPLSNSTTQVVLGQFSVMFSKSAQMESDKDHEYTIVLHGISKKLARRIYDIRVSQKPIVIDCSNIDSDMTISSNTTSDYESSLNPNIDHLRSSLFNSSKLSSQGKLDRSNKGLSLYIQGDKHDIALIADVLCDAYLTYITSMSTYAKCKYFSLPQIISNNIEFFMSVQKRMSITKIDCRHSFESDVTNKLFELNTTDSQSSRSNESMFRPKNDKTHRIQLHGYFMPETIQLLTVLLQSMALQSYDNNQSSQDMPQQQINNIARDEYLNRKLEPSASTSGLFNLQSSKFVRVPPNKVLSNCLNDKDDKSHPSTETNQNKLITSNSNSNSNKILLKNPLTILSRKIQPLTSQELSQSLSYRYGNVDGDPYSDTQWDDITSKINDEEYDRYMSSKSWLKHKKSNHQKTPFFHMKLDYCPHLSSLVFMNSIRNLIKTSNYHNISDGEFRREGYDLGGRLFDSNSNNEQSYNEYNGHNSSRATLQLPEIENFDVSKFNASSMSSSAPSNSNTIKKVSAVAVQGDILCSEIRWSYTLNRANESVITTKRKIEQKSHPTKKKTLTQIEEEEEEDMNNDDNHVSKHVTLCYSAPPKHAFLFYPMLSAESEMTTDSSSTNVALPHEPPKHDSAAEIS